MNRTSLIKSYIEQYHKRGLKPKVYDIAKAFGITTDEVRMALRKIREEKGPVDILGRMFGFKP